MQSKSAARSYLSARARYAVLGVDTDRTLGKACPTKVWIPDGIKDTPADRCRAAARAGDYTTRLVLLEEAKTLPVGAVWEGDCLQQAVPVGEM